MQKRREKRTRGIPDKLFVYGTLAPGQANEFLLKEIGGTWQEGAIYGKHYPQGIGPTRGFPVVDLDSHDRKIKGLIFSSLNLSAHWDRLDEFEGDGYQRVITPVQLEDGSRVEACIYVLDKACLKTDG